MPLYQASTTGSKTSIGVGVSFLIFKYDLRRMSGEGKEKLGLKLGFRATLKENKGSKIVNFIIY